MSENEYRLFAALPGPHSLKRRYAVADGGLDVYLRPAIGMALFEVEFADESAARRYSPPGFAVKEVTGDERFTGAAIAWGAAEP